MLKKLIFNSMLYFFLHEFMLFGMSWLSQTPEKPQPSNVFFTVESQGTYIYSDCIDYKLFDTKHLTVLVYCCFYIF